MLCTPSWCRNEMCVGGPWDLKERLWGTLLLGNTAAALAILDHRLCQVPYCALLFPSNPVTAIPENSTHTAHQQRLVKALGRCPTCLEAVGGNISHLLHRGVHHLHRISKTGHCVHRAGHCCRNSWLNREWYPMRSVLVYTNQLHAYSSPPVTHAKLLCDSLHLAWMPAACTPLLPAAALCVGYPAT